MKTLAISLFAPITLCALAAVAAGAMDPQTTFAPAWSTESAADARAQCEKPSADPALRERLGPGHAVGYPLLAQSDGEWIFIVACERTGFHGETTHGPAWTSQSFAEARKICDVASDTSSLAAGKAVGESVLARTGLGDIYLVVCERPVLAPTTETPEPTAE